MISGTDTPSLLNSINSGTLAVERGRQLIDIILREVSDSSLEQEPAFTISANEAICQAIKQYGFEHEEHRARVSLNLSHDFAIKVNDTLFNFVIFNLLRNSIYYFDSYPESQIEIRTEIQEFENCIYFKDTGPGIPSNLLSQIFDDFFSHNKSGGSGLGLGYCQRTMQAFGGRIECESEIGEYTEFKLVFPPTNFTSQFSDSVMREDIPPSATTLKKPLTVMVVDDKEIQRTLVKLYLDQLGANVILANNGLTAFEKAQKNHVDLILMDIQMPVMNGFDATKKIKRFDHNIKVVALSGESGDRELAMIGEIMDGRLEKPTSRLALQSLLFKEFPQFFRKVEEHDADLALN
ncbi:response regulator [Vibrio sonorensis]|uniref:response regulator n=1 Tax=Vibrio sonorensis TaxID=1004316 RepID=UPI000A94F03B|nr:response regulator [Vibrio sonorensis]